VRDEVFEDVENAERSGVRLDVAVVAIERWTRGSCRPRLRCEVDISGWIR
jgi:hypothetical protein